MEFDWNKYRKITIKKIVLLIIMMVLPIIIAFSLIPQYVQTFSAVHTIGGQNLSSTQVGTFCAFALAIFIEIILGYRLSCFIRIETSETYAEKYYIRTHDERNQYIDHMASSATMKLSLYILGVVTAIAGCFDQVVFYTLIAAFFSMILISLGTFLYYKHKN